MAKESVRLCTAIRSAFVQEFRIDSFHPWGADLWEGDHVKAVGGMVIAEDMERRLHGCRAGTWQIKGENLHGYVSGGPGPLGTHRDLKMGC